MTANFKRSDRVAGIFMRKLSSLIKQEINDPRLPALITISSVKVSTDLSHAKIYYTAFDSNIEQTTAILNSAAGYLRKALARTITLRTIPQLHFVYDESIEYAKHLSKLIDDVNPSENNDENCGDEQN